MPQFSLSSVTVVPIPCAIAMYRYFTLPTVVGSVYQGESLEKGVWGVQTILVQVENAVDSISAICVLLAMERFPMVLVLYVCGTQTAKADGVKVAMDSVVAGANLSEPLANNAIMMMIIRVKAVNAEVATHAQPQMDGCLTVNTAIFITIVNQIGAKEVQGCGLLLHVPTGFVGQGDRKELTATMGIKNLALSVTNALVESAEESSHEEVDAQLMTIVKLEGVIVVAFYVLHGVAVVDVFEQLLVSVCQRSKCKIKAPLGLVTGRIRSIVSSKRALSQHVFQEIHL